MSEATETALWAWFLFQSGVSTARAKLLLETWLARGLSLREALALSRSQLGISPQEAALFHPPSNLPPVTALRSDTRYAPAHYIGQGLLSLPAKLRPALIFYRGEAALLSRPLIYLAPSMLTSEDQHLLHEAISLLVDEPLLLAAYEGSAQIPLLMEELAYSTGTVVIFARTGLAVHRSSEMESALIDQRRLVLVSPLPPNAAYHPFWDTILQRVAIAAAQRILLTGESARLRETQPDIYADLRAHAAVLALTPEEAQPSSRHNIPSTSTPGDVLPWVESLLSDGAITEGIGQTRDAAQLAERDEAAAYWTGPELTELIEEELPSPPSPDEILKTLSEGGIVPETLRRRIEESQRTEK